MSKFILVDASPRKKGNSEIAIEYLAKALRDQGVLESDIHLFKIHEKSVNFCKACDACQLRDYQMCVQKDDMSALLPDLESADGIVLVSPIYNQMLSAQAVAFIDRFYPFFKADDSMWTNSKKKNKKAVVIAISWGTSHDYEKLAENSASGFCQIGAKSTRGYSFGGIKDKGDIRLHPEYFQKLNEIAQWLVK